MAKGPYSDPTPERPRAEPEIIPPGRDGVPRQGKRVWMRFEGGGGVHRIYIARPGLPSILLALFILGAIITLGFVVVAGVLLLWLPLLAIGIVASLFYAPARSRWARLLGRLMGRR